MRSIIYLCISNLPSLQTKQEQTWNAAYVKTDSESSFSSDSKRVIKDWRSEVIFSISSKQNFKLSEHSIILPSISLRQNARSLIDQIMTIYDFSSEHTESTKAQTLSVSRSKWSNNVFTIFETFVYDRETKRDKNKKLHSFSNKIVKRPSIDTHVASDVLKIWAETAKLKLKSLVSSEEVRHKVLCLLYHYRHLDEKDLNNLPCTDLITHRIQIAKETKSTSNLTQKRWSAHSE